MTPRSRRGPLHIALVSAAALAFTASTAACSPSDEQQMVQCTDQNNIVVDDDLCDNGHGGSFFALLNGSTRYPPGTQLDQSQYARPRVSSTDPVARQSAGLSANGKATGLRSVGSAGIGKGSTGGDSGGS